jgi:hypothetical protein
MDGKERQAHAALFCLNPEIHFFQIGNQKAMNNPASCAIVTETKGDNYYLN